MADIPPPPEKTVTVERRGKVALIGIHRPHMRLFGSGDFLDGRKAEAENGTPIFHGR